MTNLESKLLKSKEICKTLNLDDIVQVKLITFKEMQDYWDKGEGDIPFGWNNRCENEIPKNRIIQCEVIRIYNRLDEVGSFKMKYIINEKRDSLYIPWGIIEKFLDLVNYCPSCNMFQVKEKEDICNICKGVKDD